MPAWQIVFLGGLERAHFFLFCVPGSSEKQSEIVLIEKLANSGVAKGFTSHTSSSREGDSHSDSHFHSKTGRIGIGLGIGIGRGMEIGIGKGVGIGMGREIGIMIRIILGMR